MDSPFQNQRLADGAGFEGIGYRSSNDIRTDYELRLFSWLSCGHSHKFLGESPGCYKFL